MTPINKPISPMHAYVTPGQFDYITKQARAIAQGAPYAKHEPMLRKYIAQCVAANGGDYDADQHEAGRECALIVIVA